MTGQRIQRRRTKGWRMPEGVVYVGRPAEWSNPFRVGDQYSPYEPHTDVSIASGGPIVTVTQALAVEAFRAYVAERGWCEQIRAELAGRDLCCWCPLEDAAGNRVPCHADVLLEIANGGPP